MFYIWPSGRVLSLCCLYFRLSGRRLSVCYGLPMSCRRAAVSAPIPVLNSGWRVIIITYLVGVFPSIDAALVGCWCGRLHVSALLYCRESGCRRVSLYQGTGVARCRGCPCSRFSEPGQWDGRLFIHSFIHARLHLRLRSCVRSRSGQRSQ